MLRMTKQADYGILLLAHLAHLAHQDRGGAGRCHPARDLAAELELPLPMASKILKALARAGLLESHRGVNGGYRLARPAGQVSVAEVIAGVEGPIAVAECTSDGPAACELEPHCPTRSPMHRINATVRQALENVSLAEVAGTESRRSQRLSIAV